MLVAFGQLPASNLNRIIEGRADTSLPTKSYIVAGSDSPGLLTGKGELDQELYDASVSTLNWRYRSKTVFYLSFSRKPSLKGLLILEQGQTLNGWGTGAGRLVQFVSIYGPVVVELSLKMDIVPRPLVSGVTGSSSLPKAELLKEVFAQSNAD